MSIRNGKFFWYDLMTTDCKAAATFYGDVVGWTATDVGKPDHPYSVFSAGSRVVTGLMPIPPDARKAGVGPCWTGYVVVDDVDAYAERVKAAGGSVLREPSDIPGIMRFAVVSDPHGAVFIIFRGESAETPSLPPAGVPGFVGWHELYAGDREADFAFYANLFGWTKAVEVDSPAGPYQIFATGDAPVGGVVNKMPQMPGPYWLYYFNVEAIDSALARVKHGGGKVLHGPMEVPGGSVIAQCVDPQGAAFALVAPKQ
jgi:uncharacterized protein